jgi:hypothetical protein
MALLATVGPPAWRLLAAAGLVLGVSALSGCAAGAAGHVILLRDLPARPTLSAEWVQSDRAAAAVAMAVMEQELALPRLDVTLHFFPTRQAFQDALGTVGYDPAFAAETAGRMTAIGGFRRVLINSEALSRADGVARAALFAHELTHSLQYELGGGRRGASPQWIREGFADWVSARVLAALDVQRLEAYRDQRLDEFRDGRPGPPPLGAMTTFPEWVALAGRPDGRAIAAKAFLAVDFLIERAGMARVLEYFAVFARSNNAERAFLRVFGEPLGAFEAAFDGRFTRRADAAR